MAWIESHQALGRHPKTRKLARYLDVSRVTAVGHLHFLWWWCLDFAQDGDLTDYSDDEIAEAAEWEGTPELFVLGLEQCGFLDGDRRVHDWHDYAGKLIDQRKANAEKQKRWRDRHKQDPPKLPNDNVTVTSPLRNGATVPNRTQPNSTEPDQTVPRESSKRATRATPAPETFPLTDEMLDWAADHAPDVDVVRETERFLDRNRAQGTTYKDWHAAWRNWITSPYAKTPQRPTSRAPDLQAVNGVAMSPRMARNLRVLQETEL